MELYEVQAQQRAVTPKNPYGLPESDIVVVKDEQLEVGEEALLIRVPGVSLFAPRAIGVEDRLGVNISEYDPASPLAVAMGATSFCPYCGTKSGEGHRSDCSAPAPVQRQNTKRYFYDEGSWWCPARYLSFPWVRRPADNAWRIHPTLVRQGVQVVDVAVPDAPRGYVGKNPRTASRTRGKRGAGQTTSRKRSRNPAGAGEGG